MTIKDLKNLIDKLDPDATLFISETYNEPFRLTKISSLKSGVGQIGTLNKDGDIVKKKEMKRIYHLQVENWSSDKAASGFYQ